MDKIAEANSLLKQLETDLAQLGQVGNGQRSLVSQDAVLNLVS